VGQVKKCVRIGNVTIGGDHKIAIQSMTNTDTRDVEATVRQIHALQEAGCDIVRVAVPDEAAARCIDKIREKIQIPLVADIHFDYRLALLCIERGIDKIRINPGNIGGRDRVKAVADACRKKNIPIRIGVNLGSIQKGLLEKYADAPAMAMVESARQQIALLQQFDFEDIVISLKASDVKTTLQAYRLMHAQSELPLHLGVTEAGGAYAGTIKSAMGIGALLLDGIGSTIRVSLTDDPVEEVRVAKEILKAAGLMGGVRLISCPTCGRCGIPLISIAKQVEAALAHVDKDVTVAVMGCAVNGPGEARGADIGIAGGAGQALLFKKGEIVRKIPEERIVEELLLEIEKL
jgi:(E)-4-hydroxy-3-methylbut-2-enyl-diphosphate synthase